MKLAKNLNNLGTETAFAVLAEAKKLEAHTIKGKYCLMRLPMRCYWKLKMTLVVIRILRISWL